MEQKIESLMQEISKDLENKTAIIIYTNDTSETAINAMCGSRTNLMCAIATFLESDAGKPFMEMLQEVMALRLAEQFKAKQN